MRIVQNPYTKRIRFLALFTILIDIALTLFGQSKEYWHQAATVREGNELFQFFGEIDPTTFVTSLFSYAAIMFLLISFVPSRIAYAGSLALIFGHYYGASSWLTWFYGFGVQAAVIYAVLLSLALVYLDTEICSRGNGA